MTYGLSPQGFLKKPLEVIKSEIESSLQTAIGEINIEPESVFGQEIGTFSKALADVWDTLEAVYFSQYPSSAEGTALDNVAQLLGIIRLPATPTKVIAVLGGVEGTLIPQGSLASQPNSNITFSSDEAVVISRTNAADLLVTVSPYTPNAVYSLNISGFTYTNIANGSNVPPISNSTDLVNAFVNQIGTSVTSTNSYYATYISTSSFKITAFDSEQPFSLSNSSNLSISNVLSPVLFQASVTGPIAVPVNTLTSIITSILGWNSITNLKAGAIGTDIETDAQLRLRRSSSFILGGYATVEAIRSHLLQEVAGVVQVFITENRTMKQTDQTFSVNANFITDDTIDVYIDGIFRGNIAFNTYVTQQATMQAIADLIETADGIESATVSGSPYRSLTVIFKQGYQLTFNDLRIQRGVDQIPFVKSGGLPPKSFETTVEGGTDSDVANKIWQTKPAGIETYGNTQFNITDSMGMQQAIFFTRAVPVYIWINVVATINPEETLPTDPEEVIKNNIMAYGDTLDIGMDVINGRVLCKVIDVLGIGSAVITMYGTTDESYTPIPGDYVAGNISIADSQIAVFDKTRIQVSIS